MAFKVSIWIFHSNKINTLLTFFLLKFLIFYYLLLQKSIIRNKDKLNKNLIEKFVK